MGHMVPIGREVLATTVVISTLLLLLHVVSATIANDLIALLSLRSNLQDSEGHLNHWQASDTSPCHWTGVTCNSTGGKVIGLNLSAMKLNGSLSDDIANLAGLTTLDVDNNYLSGSLPSGISNLTQLISLNISWNNFGGVFPIGFSQLSSLQVLDAYNNMFQGSLPEDISQLSRSLKYLHFGGSNFSGGIPSSFGALTNLSFLHLGGNSLSGCIPPQLGNLTKILRMELQYNRFYCDLPPELGNLSSITYLDISNAQLTGPIPAQLGRLSTLATLFLDRNNMSGNLSSQLGDLISISSLDLSDNFFTGSIFDGISNLQNLRFFDVSVNNMNGIIPAGLGDLPNLLTLELWSNSFTGELPQQLGRKSSLEWLDVSSNFLTGSIPPYMCEREKLYRLLLFDNLLSGPIPLSLGACLSLERVRIGGNQLTGPIPTGFGQMPSLTYLDLSWNSLSGTIPEDIGSASKVLFLDVSHNQLNGGFQMNAWNLNNLKIFYASNNKLSGTLLPLFGNLSSLYILDLSENSFTGTIPGPELETCTKLTSLNLRHNQLTGSIPPAIGGMPGLNILDLSSNQLSGSLPPSFNNATTLEVFNISFNNLQGPIPTGANFEVMNASSFLGNPELCGGPGLKTCAKMEAWRKKGAPARSTAWIVGICFAVACMFLLVLGLLSFFKLYRRHASCSLERVTEEWPWQLTAFQRLEFSAHEIVACLRDHNIIGMGLAGTVYKAEMASGETVAVKKLWAGPKASSSFRTDLGFSTEVNMLGNIRHRNIVKLLGFCSNTHTNLLVYEYMPNGSLGQILHRPRELENVGENILADWQTRYNIGLGVAQGLCYLHHDCSPPIVHRDVKSNNILLDSRIEARVADFGLAKLFHIDDSMSLVAGSYGYIAPEYAYTLKVDEKSDIYSFGVVLLELLTGRQPSDPEVGDSDGNIVQWVSRKIQTKGGIAQVLDSNVGAGCPSVQEEMILVLRIALLCSSRSPRDRPSMRDVVTMLLEAEPRRKVIFK